MGAYSTMSITREDALKEILSRIVGAPDGVLEDLLFDIVGQKALYNFRVVSQYDNDGSLEYSQYTDGFRWCD